MVFVAVYSALSSSNENALTYAIVAALILAVFFGGWRLLERKRPTRVIGAIVVVALGAYFAARTGIDSLAVAIGTSHGAYKFKHDAKLAFARWMKAARAATEAGMQGLGDGECSFFEVRRG